MGFNLSHLLWLTHVLAQFPSAPALAGTQYFCRCFCGYRVFEENNSGSRILNIKDDQTQMVFDPQPVFFRTLNDLKDLITKTNALHQLGISRAGQGYALHEFFSGALAEFPPYLNPMELAWFKSNANNLTAYKEVEAAIHGVLASDPEKYADIRQIMDQTEGPGDLTKQPRLVTKPATGSSFAERIDCIQECQVEALRMPLILKKIRPFKDFGLVQPPTALSDVVSPERPIWGLRHVRIPNLQTPTVNPTWEATMARRWRVPYHLASSFDPTTGAISPKAEHTGVLMNLGRSCTDLQARLSNNQDSRVLQSWDELKRLGYTRNPADLSVDMGALATPPGTLSGAVQRQVLPHAAFLNTALH